MNKFRLRPRWAGIWRSAWRAPNRPPLAVGQSATLGEQSMVIPRECRSPCVIVHSVHDCSESNERICHWALWFWPRCSLLTLSPHSWRLGWARTLNVGGDFLRLLICRLLVLRRSSVQSGAYLYRREANCSDGQYEARLVTETVRGLGAAH